MNAEPNLQDARKTILLVDDDPGILNTVSEMLGDDYNVMTATSGAAAIRQSQEYKSEIHVLLSDFDMPGMTGVDLATRLTAERPHLKVLLMSGFTGGTLILNEGWHFLPKPFVGSQLRALMVGLASPEKTSRYAAAEAATAP